MDDRETADVSYAAIMCMRFASRHAGNAIVATVMSLVHLMGVFAVDVRPLTVSILTQGTWQGPPPSCVRMGCSHRLIISCTMLHVQRHQRLYDREQRVRCSGLLPEQRNFDRFKPMMKPLPGHAPCIAMHVQKSIAFHTCQHSFSF